MTWKALQTTNEISKENVIESFQKSKVVYMITYGVYGEIHSRPMTNFNDNPYSKMWFPTYSKTQKVYDIEKNPKTLIIFPGINEDEFFEIEGFSSFADRATVYEKWERWYLYWHPEMKNMFWFSNNGNHPERCIIDVHPISVNKLSKKDIHYIHQTYKSIIPNELLNHDIFSNIYNKFLLSGLTWLVPVFGPSALPFSFLSSHMFTSML